LAREDSAPATVVSAEEAVAHSVEAGVLGLSDTPAPGLLVHGQAGSVTALAQLLTGPAGLLELGAAVLHGRPGLDALLPSPLPRSTQPRHQAAAQKFPTPPPRSVTRSLKPQALLLPQRLDHPVLIARSLLAALPLPLSLVSLPCCSSTSRSHQSSFPVHTAQNCMIAAWPGVHLWALRNQVSYRRGTEYDTPHNLFLLGFGVNNRQEGFLE